MVGMRIPLVWIEDERRSNNKLYEATLSVEIYPGISLKIKLERLVKEPNKACCTGRLSNLDNSYIITLFSDNKPFATVYLVPPWLSCKNSSYH
ncbi:MAG: hypothetical protein F7B11_00110 [Caldisphaeraceae archaeon]|nr:hypothetical protein [Caldisphaeraceae archaeon]MEB2793568.1 hypothetical protein [Caldisphaeraceae archaeon]MEB3692229.1 hypothetical protein [Caldisphaeraceae archaeon]MEB3797786.1 hypothetical protein [Caldisphaeraceae archaeon]